jgi:hypothetical protein
MASICLMAAVTKFWSLLAGRNAVNDFVDSLARPNKQRRHEQLADRGENVCPERDGQAPRARRPNEQEANDAPGVSNRFV